MSSVRHVIPAPRSRGSRGFSLIELLVALVVLSLGVLALARLFPAASREQLRDRMRTAASYYAQDKVEALRALPTTDINLADGRHPGALTNESLGTTGAWQRYYTISHLDEPLDNLARVDVVVRWTTARGPDSVLATTYLEH